MVILQTTGHLYFMLGTPFQAFKIFASQAIELNIDR